MRAATVGAPNLLIDDLDLAVPRGVASPTASPELQHPAAVDAAALALAEEAAAAVDVLDAERGLPPDLARRAAEIGLFRQLVPTDMGGLGAAPIDWFRRGIGLARHEPSFSWVVTQGAAELAWIAVGGDPAWAAEVLADPLASSASTVAGIGSLRLDATDAGATGAGGPTGILSGAWGFDTGCRSATWIGGMVIVERPEDDPERRTDGLPELRIAWVPSDRATIVDDWDSTGLRGTGSHGVSIADQWIPWQWTVAWHEPTSNDRGPHRVLVGNGNWPIATSVAAVQLGTARAALDEVRRLVTEKAPAPAFTPLVRNAAVQRRLVELEGRWLGARAAVEHELRAMWEEAAAGGRLSTAQRVRLATVNAAANRTAVEVVDGAGELAGTEVAKRTSRLSRCLRDVHTLRGHVATNGAVLERAAQMDFGLLEDDLLV
jgi:alkylation response protein AidB-like acyl-CoA dehydrogenase